MRTRMRWGFHIVGAAVGALTLAVALEFGDPGWFDQLTRWARPNPRQVISQLPRRPDAGRVPLTVTHPRPLGNDSSLSPVPQPLLLVRTEVGRNSREGYAQIGVNSRSSQTYAAGALLANGARLTEIHEHYVLLERAGRSVRLSLQNEAPTGPQAQGPAATDLLTVGGTPPEASAQVTSEQLLTEYLKPSPVFVDGQLRGYAVFPGRTGDGISQLGLQPGDVVTQIAGTPVSANSDSLSALESLAHGETLSVIVERDGTAFSLSLDGAALRRPTPLIAPTDFSGRSSTL